MISGSSANIRLLPPGRSSAPRQALELARYRAVTASIITLILLQVRGDKIPVHHVPKRLDIVRPGIAIVDVIGVLPHVTGQKRSLVAHYRSFRVGGFLHRKRT